MEIVDMEPRDRRETLTAAAVLVGILLGTTLLGIGLLWFAERGIWALLGIS